MRKFETVAKRSHESVRVTLVGEAPGGLGAAGWGLLIAAPFVGSFLGVLIRRLPERRPVVKARSGCEHCGALLMPRDLVPLLSWVVQWGRCRYCRHPLGSFYPAVELAALAVALIAVTVDPPGRAWLDCLLGWWLLALGWIDLRCWLLPDTLTLPLILVGLAAAAALEPEQLLDRALASVLGYAVLRGIAWAYRRLRRRDGLGHGDAKLFAAAGAWLGTAPLPQVILLAAPLGLLAAPALAGLRLRAHSAVPFGPFLALAIWILWLFGPLPL